MNIYESADAMWQAMIASALNGRRLESRAGGCTEVTGWAGRLIDVDKNFVTNRRRKLSPSYAAAELLWYMSLSRDPSMLLRHAPQYDNFLDPDGTAYGSYGWRWVTNPGFLLQKTTTPVAPKHFKSQIHAATALLKLKPETRQAVVTMWDSGDLIQAIRGAKKDLPCTVAMTFYVRDGYLDCCTFMRSNDVWLGAPYDVFCFTQIQRMIADELQVETGDYSHFVGSLHVYDRDREKCIEAQDVAKSDEARVDERDGHGWINSSDLTAMEKAAGLASDPRVKSARGSGLFTGSAARDLLTLAKDRGSALSGQIHSRALRRAAARRKEK